MCDSIFLGFSGNLEASELREDVSESIYHFWCVCASALRLSL